MHEKKSTTLPKPQLQIGSLTYGHPQSYLSESKDCISNFHSKDVMYKSLNAQDECLATSPLLVTRLHLPHAILVRLHVSKSNVVILTPETVVTVGV